MGLMKQDSTPLGTLRFTLRDIESQAQAKLDQASADAQHIAAEARAGGFDEGRAEGFAEGMKQGLEHGQRQAVFESRDELASLIETLSAARDQLESAAAKVREDAIADAVELALAIAQRVTKRQAMIDPQVLLANVRDAMKLASRSNVRIALHPSQRQFLMQAMPLLQLEHPALRNTDIVDDDSLSPGGCRVFAANGKIDADINAQLDRIACELMPSSSASQV